jgi:spermidine synthase
MAAKQKNPPRAVGALETHGLATGETTLAGAALVPGALGLKLLVFVAGAVLMGLEIVGSRLLAPYFGNSVFVWGSLISLFLIALSAGYYIGGLVADRQPSQALLNSILIAVAAWMLAIPGMSGPVCDEVVAGNFGEQWGPFVASAVLFLLPSVGMGVASPFAVRLATHTVASVGKTAGTLYALSTFGSIAGTMLTTFVLIPNMGAGTILKSLALALLAVAVLTFPFRNRGAAGAVVALAALMGGSLAYAINPTGIYLPPGAKLLEDVDTPYHHISVVDDASGVRQLRFDRYTETAIDVAPPHRSRSAYTDYFHLALLPQPQVRRALFIGAGGGVGPRTFHAHDDQMEIEVIDIDAKVLELAQSHFYLEDSPQIQLTAADGRMYVRGAEAGAYDAIILDAFSIGGRIPFHLVTREFLELCRSRLAPGGVFVMNINSAVTGENAAIFRSMYKTVAAVFPETTHAFALGRGYGQPEYSTNIILTAVNRDEPVSPEDWAVWAEGYQSASYVDRPRMDAMLDDLIITLPNLGDAPVFTDDFAPIETMPF